MSSKKRRASTDFVTYLATSPRTLRRGSAPVTAEYDLNNGRRIVTDVNLYINNVSYYF